MTTTYPTVVSDVRRHPGSRVVRLIVDIDAPAVLLGVRRHLAAEAAAAHTGGTTINIIDSGRLDTTRFDVRVWLPPETPANPTLPM